MVELGAKGEKTGELVFNGNTVSVWKDEITLEMDSGDSYTTCECT
jgi:hypothetical protein